MSRFTAHLVVMLWLAAAPAVAQHPSDHATHTDAALPGEAAEEASPIQWATDLALWTVVVFLLLLWVLRKWAWRPLAEALDARERSIQKSLDDAEQARQKAQQLLLEHEQKLAGVQDEVRAILDEARRDAQHTAQEIIRKARQEAQEAHQRMLHEVERARDQALQQIAQHVATLVTETTERVIERSLSGDDHRRLIERALAEVKQNGPKLSHLATR